MFLYEFAIIGAEIVGLSTAIAVGQRYPRAKILVLEKEESIRTGFNRLSTNT
jgi:L-2-hydroxyglutarate oxidase